MTPTYCDELAALDVLADVAFAVAGDWRLVYVNPAGERWLGALGKSGDEMMGEDVWARFPALVGTRFHEALTEATATRRMVGFREFYTALGVWLEGYARPRGDVLVVVLRDVTEQQRAATALHESHELIDAVVEGTDDSVFVKDIAGRYQTINAAGARLLGQSPAAMIGRTDDDFFSAEEAALIRAADRDVIASGATQTYEMRVRVNGATRWMLVSKHAQRDRRGRVVGLAGIGRDITEWKRAQDSLAKREHQLQEAQRIAHIGSWEFDFATQTTWWSDEAYRIYGHEPGGFVPTPEAALAHVHPDDRATIETSRQRLSPGSFIDHFRIVRPDGSVRYLEVIGEVVSDDQGRPTGVIGTTQDVTERHEMAAALREREEQLRQAQKMEAIGQLAGGVAHDFNNMLTAITSFSDLLLDDLEEGDARRGDVKEIRAAADRAAALTRQLLAFSRKQVLRPQVLDLAAVVNGIRPMLQRLVGASIAFVVRAAPEPVLLAADAGQLEQVLLNLAVNARDAMPSGGTITIAVDAAPLDPAVAARHPNAPRECARLVFTDTGCGMDAEVQRRIFEPFFTTKATGKGTGLGLSTVYGIVKQSEGHITLASAPGRGTSFTIFFPLVTGDVAERAHAGASNGSRRPAAARTVLLVDDDPAIRVAAGRILKRQGYTVLEASSAYEALDVARHRAAIDLLLTDVTMPGMNGIALAAQLRAARPGIAVVYTSGFTDENSAWRTALADGHEFLEKPFTAESLTAAVERTLARR